VALNGNQSLIHFKLLLKRISGNIDNNQIYRRSGVVAEILFPEKMPKLKLNKTKKQG